MGKGKLANEKIELIIKLNSIKLNYIDWVLLFLTCIFNLIPGVLSKTFPICEVN